MPDFIEYYSKMISPPPVGLIIRRHIIPDKSVTDVAAKLGVNRVSLSRLFNGRASLSVEMAVKIEMVFRYSGKALLRYQLDRDYSRCLQDTTIYIPAAELPPALAKIGVRSK